MPLPTDLPARPAAEGVRLVALEFLDQAAAAHARLGDREDAEALHDFRVALRRLRSTMRAYRDTGGRVPKRERRGLRDLASRTNAGRDAEVQLVWLREQSGRLAARERPALRWLTERLAQRVESEYSGTVAEVQAEFPDLERKIRRRLRRYRVRLPVDGESAPLRFASAARGALEAAAAALGAALGDVRDPAEEEPAHTARIAAKRLRYVLEPLVEWVPDGAGPELVRRLKRLQDALGEVHDCHVLEAELAGAVADLGAERARQIHEAALAGGADAGRRASRAGRDGRAGLTALGRLLRARRDGLFAQLKTDWLPDAGAGFVSQVMAAAAALGAERALSPRPDRRPRAWRRGAGAPPGGRRGHGA